MKKIKLNNKKILITGSCGFIGYFVCKKLFDEYNDITIIGIDNINDYYDEDLKKNRLNLLKKNKKFIFYKEDISNKDKLLKIFDDNKPNIVINLSAQAGVRYSIGDPDSYINSNIIGFYNILEACRYNNIENLVFASSSSVYGNSDKYPSCVSDNTDKPISLYAATKKCDEILAYTYSSLYNINCTGLRFFTVYGPLGRPDMAYFSFCKKLINNETIKLFNYGNCLRDYTYIDDIVNGIFKVIHCPQQYKIYNIGHGSPVKLLDFVTILKDEMIKNNLLDKDFDLMKHVELVEKQKGDVDTTYCDTSELEKDFNYVPCVDFKTGISNFVKWFKDYYK